MGCVHPRAGVQEYRACARRCVGGVAQACGAELLQSSECRSCGKGETRVISRFISALTWLCGARSVVALPVPGEVWVEKRGAFDVPSRVQIETAGNLGVSYTSARDPKATG